jgi:hypothetical protein
MRVLNPVRCFIDRVQMFISVRRTKDRAIRRPNSLDPRRIGGWLALSRCWPFFRKQLVILPRCLAILSRLAVLTALLNALPQAEQQLEQERVAHDQRPGLGVDSRFTRTLCPLDASQGHAGGPGRGRARSLL